MYICILRDRVEIHICTVSYHTSDRRFQRFSRELRDSSFGTVVFSLGGIVLGTARYVVKGWQTAARRQRSHSSATAHHCSNVLGRERSPNLFIYYNFLRSSLGWVCGSSEGTGIWELPSPLRVGCSRALCCRQSARRDTAPAGSPLLQQQRYSRRESVEGIATGEGRTGNWQLHKTLLQ